MKLMRNSSRLYIASFQSLHILPKTPMRTWYVIYCKYVNILSANQFMQAPEVIESRDYFALGQSLGEIISPFLTPLYMQTIQDNVSWKDLQSSLDIMCARNPDLRLSPGNVLGTTFFKDNVLIDIVETFKEIQGIQGDIKRRLFR
jgi:hypothetical protein